MQYTIHFAKDLTKSQVYTIHAVDVVSAQLAFDALCKSWTHVACYHNLEVECKLKWNYDNR